MTSQGHDAPIGIDWDDAFDNSTYVPGAERLGDTLAARAASYRRRAVRRPPEGGTQAELAYGDAPRNRLDLFHPGAASLGLVVFVHGGYWHRLDKSYWSHLSAGLCRLGFTVAVPSYTLAPQARLSAITREIAAAIGFAAARVDGDIRLVGHSAGGHLVSRMACSDQVLPQALRARLVKVVSVSGIHDLRPLLATKMNGILGLDEAEARAESPALHAPDPTIDTMFWVGAQERPELIRQTRLIAERWERSGGLVASRYESGRNHFSVIDALARSTSPLTREVARSGVPA